MWSGLNDHRWGPTMETRRIEIAPGMTFDVSVDGIDAAPLVLMLHGFGVSRFFWNSQVHALGDAGYFAVAPNQRGYAAGARPDPTDYASYRVDRLIGDALDIVAAVGHGDRRFHLVGHDWGASLAWQIADQHPERLVSLTILSRPHPLAFARALATAGRRAASAVRAPSDIPGTGCWFEHLSGQCELVADAPDQERCPSGRDRGPPVRDRQPAGYGSCTGVVSGTRCPSCAGGTNHSADALHLGRSG